MRDFQQAIMDNSDLYGWCIVPGMGKSSGLRGTIQLAAIDENTLKEIKNKIVTRLINTGGSLESNSKTRAGWPESSHLPGVFVWASPG